MLAPAASTRKVARSSANVLALAAAIGLLYYGRVFFITVIIAAMIAMLLDPLVDLFVKLRLPRGAGSFAVCSLALMFLYLAGVGAYTQLIAMIDDLPAYSNRINELVDSAAARVDRVEQGVYRTLVPKRFQERNQPLKKVVKTFERIPVKLSELKQ